MGSQKDQGYIPARYVFLIAIIVSTTGTETSDVYFGDYKTYLEKCAPVTTGYTPAFHQLALNAIRQYNINTTWLPMTRRDLGGWKWLSGEAEPYSSLLTEQNNGIHCGVVRVADKIIDEALCSKQYTKFICEQTGDLCGNNQESCIVNNGKTYTIYNEKVTWYQARTLCTLKGLELASLPKRHQPVLLENIKIKIKTKTFLDVWVGLRKSDYLEHDSNIFVNAFYWNDTLSWPLMKQQNCVILHKKSNNHAFWEASLCTPKIYFICLTNATAITMQGGSIPVTTVAENNVASGYNQHFVTTSENIHSTTEMPLSPSCNCTKYLVFIVILFTYALATSGMSVILLYKLKRKGKTESKDMEDQSTTQPLLDRRNQADKLDAAKPPGETAEQWGSSEENGLISRNGGAKLLTSQEEVSSNTILKEKSELTLNESRSSEEDKIDEKDTSSRNYINHSKEDQEEQELTKILSELAMPTGTTHYRVAQISRFIECGCRSTNVFGPWHVHVYYNSMASCLATDGSYGGFFKKVDFIPAQLILIQSYRGSSFSLIITKGKFQDTIFKDNTENITSERHKDSKKVTCTVKGDKTMLQEHKIKTIKTPAGSDKTDYEGMRNKPENITTKENKGTAAIEEIDKTIKDKDQGIGPSTLTFDIVFQQSDDSRDFFDIATNYIYFGSETAVAN